MDNRLYLKKKDENIRSMRLQKDISQVELSDLCNFEKSSINRIEEGRINPTEITLKKIADCLNVIVKDFFKQVLNCSKTLLIAKNYTYPKENTFGKVALSM